MGTSPDAIIFNNKAQQQEGGVSHIRRINEFASTNNPISGVSHSFYTEEHIGTLALNEEQWRGVDHRTPNETTMAPLDPATLPHAPQHPAVVEAEPVDEMDLDSAAYEAYWERMESRLVEIELRTESIFATPLTMMRTETERMNSETERVNWEFRMELQRAEREAHWDQQQEDFKETMRRSKHQEQRMKLVYAETKARLERLNAIVDQMNDTTDQINRILESCVETLDNCKDTLDDCLDRMTKLTTALDSRSYIAHKIARTQNVVKATSVIAPPRSITFDALPCTRKGTAIPSIRFTPEGTTIPHTVSIIQALASLKLQQQRSKRLSLTGP